MDLDWEKLDETGQMIHHETSYVEDWEEDFEEEGQNPAVSEAIKRIEQAKLYESILKHDFFAPGSARPEIQNKVTSEIRSFIEERLSELVGITTPKQVLARQTELPWDESQIQALTAVANRLVQKNSGTQPLSQPIVQPFTSRSPEPVVNVRPAPPQQYTAQPSRRPNSRQAPAPKTKVESPQPSLPSNVKLDPATGNPVSDSGTVLYKGQKTSAKNPPKKMPSPQEESMMHSAQVQRNMQGGSVGDKLLNLAITSAQHNNRNIIEE